MARYEAEEVNYDRADFLIKRYKLVPGKWVVASDSMLYSMPAPRVVDIITFVGFETMTGEEIEQFLTNARLGVPLPTQERS